MATIVWRGISVEVKHTPRFLNSHLDHIEITSEDRVALPITETGYRSHFIDPSDLEDYTSPEDFVLTWLEITGKDWAGAQLTLF